jgi:hypothetical protein
VRPIAGTETHQIRVAFVDECEVCQGDSEIGQKGRDGLQIVRKYTAHAREDSNHKTGFEEVARTYLLDGGAVALVATRCGEDAVKTVELLKTNEKTPSDRDPSSSKRSTARRTCRKKWRQAVGRRSEEERIPPAAKCQLRFVCASDETPDC